MIELIKGWTVNIVTLVLIIVLLEILIPTGKIRKFVDLVSGFILLIAIISPIVTIFDKGINLEEYHMVSSNFLDRKSIELSSNMLNEQQMQQITKSYRNKLIHQIEENTKQVKGINSAKADIIINEDYNSEGFGQIKRVYLNLLFQGDDTQVKPVANIEKVIIKAGDDKKVNSKNTPDPKFQGLKKDVESKISELLQIPKENIVISIDES